MKRPNIFWLVPVRGPHTSITILKDLLGTQMYSNRSKYFLDKFEKATNKRYEKIDTGSSPKYDGKRSFMKDEQCEERVNSLNKSSSTPPIASN